MSGESRPLTSRQPHSLSLGPGGHLSWAKLGQVSPELPGPAEAKPAAEQDCLWDWFPTLFGTVLRSFPPLFISGGCCRSS